MQQSASFNQLVNTIREFRLKNTPLSIIERQLVNQGNSLSYTKEAIRYVLEQDSNNSSSYNLPVSQNTADVLSKGLVNYSSSEKNGNKNTSTNIFSTSNVSLRDSHSANHILLILGIIFIIAISVIVYGILSKQDNSNTSSNAIDYSTDITVLQNARSLIIDSTHNFPDSNKPVLVTAAYSLIDKKTNQIIISRKSTHLVTSYEKTSDTISIPQSIYSGEYVVTVSTQYASFLPVIKQIPVMINRGDSSNSVVSSNISVSPLQNARVSDLPSRIGLTNPVLNNTHLDNLSLGVPDSSGNINASNSASLIPDTQVNAQNAESFTQQQLETNAILTKIENAKILSVSNPSDAAKACLALVDSITIDGCFHSCAMASGNYAFCDEINSLRNRDSCYIGYVITYLDYPACNAISNQKMKQSCFRLDPNFGISSFSNNQSNASITPISTTSAIPATSTGGVSP